MKQLKNGATLAEIQAYVRDMEAERGFDADSTNIQNALQLGEEVGELFKAIRKAERMRIDGSSSVGTIDEELADVLIFTASLANRYGVDLETAFREKERVNEGRKWE